MSIFGRERRPDVPRLDIRGDEATVIPRTGGVEESPPVPEPEEPRDLKLPKTKWY